MLHVHIGEDETAAAAGARVLQSASETQQLVLAPQMRQSLKILQVAALDLRATVQEELQSNPTLEFKLVLERAS